MGVRSQLLKFYATSFLKNQTYFTPVLIVFLQAQSLSMSEIFLVFTIGSIVSLLMEIPTGIFADFYGKKRSTILSKFMIFVSFLVFGFSQTFWMFVIAQILFELGNSFRTGTETAYVFDYLDQTEGAPSYTEVKGKQKFWARTGEAIATAAGGVIAAQMGFRWVFFIAAVPAFANFVIALLWEEIKERRQGLKMKESLMHAKQSFCRLCESRGLLRITVNIALFTGVLAALSKFIQPYMVNAGIAVQWFGFIYSASLILTAIAVRYSYLLENRFGRLKTMNALTLMAVVPPLIIGFKFMSVVGVLLFFLVVIAENIRSPVANHIFHGFVRSRERATLGSIMSLFKSLGKSIIMPIAGYISGAFSLYVATFVLGVMLLFNYLFFRVR